MRWQSPEYFGWLLLLPVILAAIGFWSRRIQGRLDRALGAPLVKVLAASVSIKKRRWKLLLQALVVALMILALARPQLGETKTEVKSQGVELMLLVDVSDSMTAEDVKPSRLGQAKVELGKLIDRLPGHKIGVVAFAGSAALQSPLTSDPAALKMFLDSLSPATVSSQGTAFGPALESAAAAFERGGVTPSPSVRVTRVILMVSDGEDHDQGALDFARKLTEKGIRIFTLAYGTEAGGPIPQRDSLGYLRGYKKDRAGKEIVTQVKSKALENLAEAGKGTFAFATFGGSHIETLAQAIDQLEKTDFESDFNTTYDEKFQSLLLLALALALIEVWMGDRRAAPLQWRGRFEGVS